MGTDESTKRVLASINRLYNLGGNFGKDECGRRGAERQGESII